MTNKLLAVALCIFGYIASAQEVPSNIKIDFLNPTTTKKYKTAKFGDKIVVIIQNINKNLYSINDSLKQSDFNTDLPSIFQGIKLPGYLNLSLPDVSKSSGTAAAPSVSNTKNEINKNLMIINDASKYISLTADYNNKLSSLYQRCGEAFSAIEKELRQVTDIYLPSSDGQTRENQIKELRSELEQAISKALSAKTKIEGALPKYISMIEKEIQSLKNGVIWEHENFPTPKTSKNPAVYRRELVAVRNARNRNEAYAAHKDSVLATVKKAFEQVAEMEKFRDENRIEILVNNYKLINEANFTYVSDTLEVKKDEIQLKIRVKATKALACNGHDKFVFEDTYRTKGGWKVDFSTGIFFNAGNQDFLGRELQYKTAPDSTVSIQSKDGGNRILLSIGALMHIYVRSGTNLNFAISPGLSTTTSFDGLNFHLGGSLLYGKEDRLVVTLGVTIREAKILDMNYTLDKPYQKTELPEAPPTIKVFPKFGGFLSLTYNWRALQKK